MVTNGLRALLSEPRPAEPPVRVWRDWALLGAAVAASLIEVALHPDRTWLLAALAVSIVVALCVLWRRTHPLAAVAVAFGTLIVFDVARIVESDATGLASIGFTLVLPYALFRWGSGREAAIGLGIILVWPVTTHVADPTTVNDVVAAYGFFLFSAALGASIRFHATTRVRDVEQAELGSATNLLATCTTPSVTTCRASSSRRRRDRPLAARTPRSCAGRPRNHRASSDEGTGGDAHHCRCPTRGAGRTSPLSPALPTLSGSPAPPAQPRIDVHLSGALARPPCGGQRPALPDRAGSPTNTMRHARNATHAHIDVVV